MKLFQVVAVFSCVAVFATANIPKSRQDYVKELLEVLAVMNQVSDDYPLDDPKDYSIEGPKVDGPVDEDPRDYSREDSRDYSMEDYSMEDPRDYSIEDTRSDDETEQSLKEKVMAYVCEIAPELPACQAAMVRELASMAQASTPVPSGITIEGCGEDGELAEYILSAIYSDDSIGFYIQCLEDTSSVRVAIERPYGTKRLDVLLKTEDGDVCVKTRADVDAKSDECQGSEAVLLVPLPIPMEGELKTVIFGTNECGRIEFNASDCA